jgi:hypothetical protein
MSAFPQEQEKNFGDSIVLIISRLEADHSTAFFPNDESK